MKLLAIFCSFFCSVAVQNDFVRLSQSLQVELEKIRQAEKEARFIFSLSLSHWGALAVVWSHLVGAAPKWAASNFTQRG